MVNVKLVVTCETCKEIAKINDVFVKQDCEETYLVKEYLCDCGHFTIQKEVINYVIQNKDKMVLELIGEEIRALREQLYVNACRGCCAFVEMQEVDDNCDVCKFPQLIESIKDKVEN